MKKKILIGFLAFFLTFPLADRVKAFAPAVAIPVAALAAYVIGAAGAGIYSASGTPDISISPDGALQAAGYAVQWIDAHTPGDLTGAVGPTPFGYPIYYGEDLSRLFPEALANPGMAPYLEGIANDHSGEPAYTGELETGDYMPCLNHLEDASQPVQVTGTEWKDWAGQYDSLNRLLTAGFHEGGYLINGLPAYFANYHSTRLYYAYLAENGYYKLKYINIQNYASGTVEDLLPGSINIPAATLDVDPDLAFADLNALIASLGTVKVADVKDGVDSAPPYAGLTPADLQNALAQNNVDVLQAAADAAQALSDSDPTNTVAAQNAIAAQAAAADAQSQVAEQQVAEPEEETVIAPVLPVVDPGSLDFSPLAGLGDTLMTKQPFVWLALVDGAVDTLLADPVPPNFVIDLGFSQREIDFSVFDGMASNIRAVMSFVLLIGTVFVCVRIWNNQ